MVYTAIILTFVGTFLAFHNYGTTVSYMWHDRLTIVKRSCHNCETINFTVRLHKSSY